MHKHASVLSALLLSLAVLGLAIPAHGEARGPHGGSDTPARHLPEIFPGRPEAPVEPQLDPESESLKTSLVPAVACLAAGNAFLFQFPNAGLTGTANSVGEQPAAPTSEQEAFSTAFSQTQARCGS